MRAPLTVRIADGVRDQHITRFVTALRFTKTAPGGHHSASISIEAPDGMLTNLGPAGRVFIYDGRGSDVVWDGYVENPGRNTVAGGETYDLSAMGGVVLASDNVQAVVFRSTDLAGPQWQRYILCHEDATVEVDQSIVVGTPAIKALIPPKSNLTLTGKKAASLTNGALASTGQRTHAVSVMVRGGRNETLYSTLVVALNTDRSSGVQDLSALSTTDAPMGITPAGSLTPGLVYVGLTLAGGAADPDVAEDMWAAFYNFVLTPTLLTASGGNATPASLSHVLPHEVVAHVVGAMLPQIDSARTTIEAATFQIDNLSYLDGAKPSQILDDLALWEPDHLWEILESGSNGKHRFAYRQWPTTPRYEISGREFTESGGEVDLCNRIMVSWTDELGAKQTTVRTTYVEALGTRVRDAEPITLPDGMGSLVNAERIGDEVLAALNSPTRSGSATISQPIFDRLASRMVMPWEIEPGYLVRVRDRGIDLRLTEMTYDDSSVSTSLTLGSPVLSLEQRLARLRR